MSTESTTIEGKIFYYEIVTYKAGTEDLLKKNLKAKFGDDAVESLFSQGGRIPVDALVDYAVQNKESSKSLLERIESSAEATIKNKLNEMYGKKDDNGSPVSEDEGEEVVVDDDDEPGEDTHETEQQKPVDNRPPMFYAQWYYQKYAYITIAMQEDLWELFNSRGARFKRMIAGWANAMRDDEKREKIGQWLMGNQSSAALGGQAAMDWAKNKLQNKIDANQQRKDWKRQNKNRKSAEKFDDKEKKRREKELERVKAGGQYRSFATAVDYENYRQKKHDQILNRGLGRGAVRTRREARHDIWDSTGQVGNENQIKTLLTNDFGETIASGEAIDKLKKIKMTVLSPDKNNAAGVQNGLKPFDSKDDADNAIKNTIANQNTYFLVAPYRVDHEKIGYSIDADDKTKSAVNKYIRNNNIRENKKTLTFDQLKKIIIESLKDEA